MFGYAYLTDFAFLHYDFLGLKVNINRKEVDFHAAGQPIRLPDAAVMLTNQCKDFCVDRIWRRIVTAKN